MIPPARSLLAIIMLLTSLSAAGAVEMGLLASVTVNPSPLHLQVEVEVLTPAVQQGENLLFQVALSKDGGNEISVDLLYEVLQKKGKKEEVLLSEQDSMMLTDANASVKELLIPSDAKSGKYDLRVTARHFNQTAMDEDSFMIQKRGNKSLLEFLERLFHAFF